MTRDELPAAFLLSASALLRKVEADGKQSLQGYPGIVAMDVGKWTIETHAHDRVIDNLPPFTMRVSYNGWPAGLVDANGGIIAGGKAANEDTFIAALEEFLAETGKERD